MGMYTTLAIKGFYYPWQYVKYECPFERGPDPIIQSINVNEWTRDPTGNKLCNLTPAIVFVRYLYQAFLKPLDGFR